MHTLDPLSFFFVLRSQFPPFLFVSLSPSSAVRHVNCRFKMAPNHMSSLSARLLRLVRPTARVSFAHSLSEFHLTKWCAQTGRWT